MSNSPWNASGSGRPGFTGCFPRLEIEEWPSCKSVERFNALKQSGRSLWSDFAITLEATRHEVSLVMRSSLSGSIITKTALHGAVSHFRRMSHSFPVDQAHQAPGNLLNGLSKPPILSSAATGTLLAIAHL